MREKIKTKMEGVWGCYVDVSRGVLPVGGEEGWCGGGMVPCRGIWDGEGRRMEAVLLFDSDR